MVVIKLFWQRTVSSSFNRIMLNSFILGKEQCQTYLQTIFTGYPLITDVVWEYVPLQGYSRIGHFLYLCAQVKF